ncbi:hypothetical protein [Saccharicrinis sp. FJH54]|uniref:hypothetical protein n=1 Tax=Saccharicrinis sp. FJH54 TaxID=3344665 RepID=UPI0035D46755
MKKNIFPIILAVLVLGLGLIACQPEEYSLGEAISKDQLDFSITQNADDPNMIILESMTPGVTPLWITPMGRSTKVKDTVKLAFAGDYSFVYGVLSAGGFVQADTFKLTLNTSNLSYVNDPLWIYLTGGVDSSKTWVADNGKYGLAPGAMSYADPNTTVEFDDYTPNWEPAGNALGSSDEDMGWGSTMTFSLQGGAIMTTNKINEGGIQETGTFFLNVKAHTLSTTDATILRPDNFIVNAENWTKDLKVLTLNENQLRIAVMRTNDEGPWWYIWNYVAKDYADNYVFAEPEPELPDGWQDDVTTVVSRKIKWVLSPETPFNWANLDGSLMNTGWVSPDTYADWTGFNATIPETYANFSLTLNADDNTAVFVAPDGTVEEGTYTLDDKGVYTFDGLKPSFNICSWVNLSTTAENQWRILSIEKDPTGAISGMWVGSRDPAKPEYMTFHLLPQLGGGEADPLAPWKSALVGKTFVPDVNWFVDWVTSPPNFTGGWTSASTFGDDFTSNGWIWTEDTRNIAESASLTFFMDGENIMCTKSQAGADDTTSVVTIDPKAATLVFGMQLINYDGSPASWLPRGGDGVTWHFVGHGGSNLGNIATEGMWLGFENAKPGENDKPDGETTILHYIIKPE